MSAAEIDPLEATLIGLSVTVPDHKGVIRYKTQFSTYEVDWTNLRVRRMEGQLNPTPRQGDDGEWQNALRIGVGWGNCLVFVWRIEDGVAKSTITSQVVSEEPAPLACELCPGEAFGFNDAILRLHQRNAHGQDV